MLRAAPSASRAVLTGPTCLPGSSGSAPCRRIDSRISASLNSAVSPPRLGRIAGDVAEVGGDAGAGGPEAAILSSTRLTMMFAPAWRYWKIASWKRRMRS
jgi:hypothetical protein